MTAKWRAPRHLQPQTRAWCEALDAGFELEEHHHRLLALAGELWDRGEEARKALAKHGLTYVDRFGSPRQRPEWSIERDAKIGYARLMRELALDVPPPDSTSRPPRIGRDD